MNFYLPTALDNGYVLNTTNTGNSIVINATTNQPQGLQNTFLIAHQRGELLFKKYQETNSKTLATKIPTTSLNDGVVNITLFNSEGLPVAERTVFVDNPNNNLKLTIKNDKPTYQSREKVTLNLAVNNKNGINQASTLSLAVRDLNAFPHNTRTNNIKTYLLLNSDLRGTIEDPNYFFEKENDPRRRYLLDLVMMTNGWKRFTWQELLYEETKKQEFIPEEGLYISGVTQNLKRPYEPIKTNVRLTFFDKILAQTPVQKTDSLGNFSFGPNVYPDSIFVFIEARIDKFGEKEPKYRKVADNRNILVTVDSISPSPQFNKKNTILVNKKRQEANFIKVTKYLKQVNFEYDQEAELLKTVELKYKNKKREEEMFKQTMYWPPRWPNIRYDLTTINTDTLPTTMWEALLSIPELGFKEDVDDKGILILRRRGNVYRSLTRDRWVVDFYRLNEILTDEISFIDVIGRMIHLYSKPGREGKGNATAKRKPGIVNFTAPGFYMAREFADKKNTTDFDYMKYSKIKTTLHWEPIIKTNTKNPTEISFLTNDAKTDYIIEIEGITANGQPIHAVKIFNVE